MNYSDDASGFVSLSHEIPELICEIRYHSSYNFTSDRVDGYNEPLALATKETCDALAKAVLSLKEKGYLIKVWDAYRPQMAVDHFVRWAEDINDIRMKSIFYPDIDKKDLFSNGYIAMHSGHSRGSTVDVTLFDAAMGCEVDMGGPFDYFGDLSHPGHKEGLTDKQYNNRLLLRDIMLQSGFRGIDSEWWHFTLKNEPYPDTYFTFPIEMASLRK